MNHVQREPGAPSGEIDSLKAANAHSTQDEASKESNKDDLAPVEENESAVLSGRAMGADPQMNPQENGAELDPEWEQFIRKEVEQLHHRKIAREAELRSVPPEQDASFVENIPIGHMIQSAVRFIMKEIDSSQAKKTKKRRKHDKGANDTRV